MNMSYTYNIAETFIQFNNELYKMIEIRIISINSKFQPGAMSFVVKVQDAANGIYAFRVSLSGNQKELSAFFTVDAFENFSNNSDVKFGYGFNLTNTISNVNVHEVIPLLSVFEDIPHEIADNDWLESIQQQ